MQVGSSFLPSEILTNATFYSATDKPIGFWLYGLGSCAWEEPSKSPRWGNIQLLGLQVKLKSLLVVNGKRNGAPICGTVLRLRDAAIVWHHQSNFWSLYCSWYCM